jgi:lipopolysaccharide/colanic/teichoic acid biosynthesis glycosyltransferase
VTRTVQAPTLIYRENRITRRWRRVFDVLVSSLALVVAAPIIAMACVAIRLDDGAPLIFRQRRVGRFERTFTIYKLRTMRREDCENRQSPTDGSDPRITRVGRFLRKTSIDELPQLFNVLRGEMSLVGPRPEMPMIVSRYEKWQNLRHLMSPGLTCIWQTTCRSTVPLDRPEATALDVQYIQRASALLDGSLLLRTFSTIFFQRGAF